MNWKKERIGLRCLAQPRAARDRGVHTQDGQECTHPHHPQRHAGPNIADSGQEWYLGADRKDKVGKAWTDRELRADQEKGIWSRWDLKLGGLRKDEDDSLDLAPHPKARGETHPANWGRGCRHIPCPIIHVPVDLSLGGGLRQMEIGPLRGTISI